MNRSTQYLAVAGAAGAIDVALDLPASPVRAVAVIAHPHPLYGGTRDNKVVQTIARALLSIGFACWRPNFRGVGASEGAHDGGIGETDDLLRVVHAARTHASAPAGGEFALAGFSFGCFVQSRVAAALAGKGAPASRVALVAPAVSRFDLGAVPPDTLVVHGELDDVVPLASVLAWAGPLDLAVTVVPGGDHFFHHKLPLLKRIVLAAFAPKGIDRTES